MREIVLCRRILWAEMVEGREQEALGRILNHPLSFKEPQSNLEQTQVNVENMSGISSTRGDRIHEVVQFDPAIDGCLAQGPEH